MYRCGSERGILPTIMLTQGLQNEAAKDIICMTCRSTFLKTTRAPALTEHAANKHNKTLQDCFPGFVEAPKK